MFRKSLCHTTAILGILLLVAACGGGNPAGPSGGPAGTGGATIAGTVNATVGGSSGGVLPLDGSGVTVGLAGSNVKVSTDNQGRFTLGGVPAGTVVIEFTSASGSATVTLADVQAGQQITIAVSLKGGHASLDSEQRSGSGKVEVEGLITAVNTGASTFDVGSTRVRVTATTTIRHGDTAVAFSSLAVGDRVHVRGVPETGGAVVADEVKLQNPASVPPPQNGTVQMEGRIAALNPGGTSRTLLVDNTQVSVPAAAVIRHGETTVDFTALKVGDRVHVTGTMNGAVLVATLVKVQNTNANVPVNAKGTVSALQTGYTCPSIRFTVEGWVVETNASTAFEKGACTAVVNGATVHVKGDVQQSGRVLASWVQIGK